MPASLFDNFDLQGLLLKNRTVMAPMTRCRASEGDVPTDLMATYYAQRATAGLIVTEGTPVSPGGRGYLWTPGIYTQAQIDGWKKVTNAVHDADGKIFMQIWHVGRISHTSILPDGTSPAGPTSELSSETVCFAFDEDGNPGNVATSQPQALDEEGIKQIKDDFVQAAVNAIEAGMDGVEVHGANGYLFDQFINPAINTRTDHYGGSIENRCRLLLEVVEAVGNKIGFDKTGVRISPNGRFNAIPEDPQLESTFVYLCSELDKLDIAYLHINDQATFGNPAIPDGLLPVLRNAFSGTIIVCGGYNAERAKAVLNEGIADLVAFGVPYIANPDLPARLENDWPLNEADQATFYGGGEKGYTDYPTFDH